MQAFFFFLSILLLLKIKHLKTSSITGISCEFVIFGYTNTTQTLCLDKVEKLSHSL